MISCPNCNHQNPDGAVQCEACYTPLPLAISCPQCGASVQENATFCGQCGFNLKANATSSNGTNTEVPSTVVPPQPDASEADFDLIEIPEIEILEIEESTPALEPDAAASPEPEAQPTAPAATMIQTQSAKLLHVQTDVPLTIASGLSVVHIGKPNDVVPPDIDVSGFPNSEVVSRVHADLRLEEGSYYIEDTGSSNGTYINHVPLTVGNRHRLRAGDRIALGKGDKVTFIFQMS
ncbi:MAG: FHA domain-containing protein [Limnothrix sp.]